MEEIPVSPPKGKREGTSLGSAFFLLLALAVLVIVGLLAALYFIHGENLRITKGLAEAEQRAKRYELEQKTGAEKERLMRAENRQQDVLRQARAATNSLENLLAEIKELNAGAAALRSNEDGKRVALHPDLIERARLFYDVQLRDAPAAADVIPHLEAARRIEQQVLSQQGTAYEPAPDILESARNAAASAEQDRGKVGQLRTYLAALVQESRSKHTEAKLTAGSPILEEAIKAKVTAAAAVAQQRLVDQTTDAQQQAVQTVADAEAKRIIEEANQKAAKILAEAEEKKAAWERQRILADADQKKKDADTEDERQRKLREARMVELRRKASDPQVQAKLAPFTTPGYWQISHTSRDLKPISFTALKTYGALETNTLGMNKLAVLVWTSSDKVRPRWDINPQLYSRYPATVERLKQLQDLLVELGPALVQMKLLEP
jgi:hypothetical protein